MNLGEGAEMGRGSGMRGGRGGSGQDVNLINKKELSALPSKVKYITQY